MQADWASVGRGADKLSVFIATLGRSRAADVEFCDDERVKTLIAAHENAFLAFGGVLREVLYDIKPPARAHRGAGGRAPLEWLPHLYGLIAQAAAKRKDAIYAEFLEDVLKAEREARRVRAREMLTRTAGFPALKTLEAYDLAFATGAPRQQIQELAALGFVERAENIVLLGPSGTGKTHFAIAFGLLAAHNGWKGTLHIGGRSVIALEAAQRQGRMKEVMHRTVAMPKPMLPRGSIGNNTGGSVPRCRSRHSKCR